MAGRLSSGPNRVELEFGTPYSPARAKPLFSPVPTPNTGKAALNKTSANRGTSTRNGFRHDRHRTRCRVGRPRGFPRPFNRLARAECRTCFPRDPLTCRTRSMRARLDPSPRSHQNRAARIELFARALGASGRNLKTTSLRAHKMSRAGRRTLARAQAHIRSSSR